MKQLSLLAVLFLVPSSSAQEIGSPRTPPVKQAKDAGVAHVTGVYQIQGIDEAKIRWIGTLVIGTEKNGDIAGYIDWIGSRGQSGRERIEGTYDQEDRRLRFTGKTTEMNNNIVRGVYRAEITQAGNSMSGKWNGYRNQGVPGVFNATRIKLPK